MPKKRITPFAASAAFGLFTYLVLARTQGITQGFWLLGDQIRDWRIALGPLHALPLVGPSSSVGGSTIGPIYYWLLWFIRVTVGPWVDNLPHAGGIGLSIVQSAADAWLLLAVWTRFRSLPLALAVTLFAATAPFDMALTATIWNPPFAVAFIKASIGCVLWAGDEASMAWEAAAIAFAWLAVQAHSSAVFFAAAVIVSFAAGAALDRRWRSVLRHLVLAGAVVLVLQVPFLVNRIVHPAAGVAPGLVVDGFLYTLAHPAALRPGAAYHAIAGALAFILVRPWAVPLFGVALAACLAVALLRVRRNLSLVAVTAGPFVLAIIGFSFWQRPFDSYWFLTLAPSAALSAGLALTAWPRVAGLVSLALALLVITMQPARLADARRYQTLPEYGPLVRGSREIRLRAPEVRRIEVTFPLPVSTDPDFLYMVLGGRVSPGAPFDASIDASGRARFIPVGSEVR